MVLGGNVKVMFFIFSDVLLLVMILEVVVFLLFLFKK